MTLRSPVRMVLLAIYGTTAFLGVFMTSLPLMLVSGASFAAVYAVNRRRYVYPVRTILIGAALYATLWVWWAWWRSLTG